jgi:opacity protein-like surface antigen
MRSFGLMAMAAFLVTVALPLQAQERWTLEFTGGAAVPTGDLGDLDLNAGLAFGGTVSAKVMPHLGIYAGWDWAHFSSDETGPGGELDVEETGYVLGLRFEHPFRGETGFPMFRVQAGGTYKHIEIEDEEGELIADSGHGLGWEVGAGLVLPLGEQWTATPGFRFRSLSRDLDLGAGAQSVDLRYVGFEVGFAWRF